MRSHTAQFRARCAALRRSRAPALLCQGAGFRGCARVRPVAHARASASEPKSAIGRSDSSRKISTVRHSSSLVVTMPGIVHPSPVDQGFDLASDGLGRHAQVLGDGIGIAAGKAFAARAVVLKVFRIQTAVTQQGSGDVVKPDFRGHHRDQRVAVHNMELAQGKAAQKSEHHQKRHVPVASKA